ncbi:hypothetical protein CWI36_0929p0010 [Hamiltosporidium magnivora]|uniref:Uncharacterized protein n=1 Tax=Hamiltosporidium magnivora TaxID=148818 RepID=A0A4Q9L787_9MICR|nr:hypothetical protein CWI36_0929p0010 [Hamiltosporidium magnivora]
MKIKECGFCRSKKLVFLLEKIYCEECEVYFKFKNNKYEACHLPTTDINNCIPIRRQICDKCIETDLEKSIRCRNFNEYFLKVHFCNFCKDKLRLYMKTLFYKRVMLYKQQKRVVGFRSLLFYIFIALFSIFYRVFRPFVFLYHEKYAFKLSISFIFKRLIFLLLYFSIGKEVCYVFFLIYSLYSLTLLIETYFLVPLILDENQNDDNLLVEHIDRLRIEEKDTKPDKK